MADAEIGLIGLGVMGSNLALNIAEKGNRIAVFNRTTARTDAFDARCRRARSDMIVPCETIEELAAAIRPPRPVIIMVQAGAAGRRADRAAARRPLGQRHHHRRRQRQFPRHDAPLQGTRGLRPDLHRHGRVGRRGGRAPRPVDHGRRHRSILEARREGADSHLGQISRASPAPHGSGTDGAGHFVKTIHNGIEYADMQMIAEIYGILRDGLGMAPKEIGDGLRTVEQGPAQFLSDRDHREGACAPTIPKTGKPMVDMILDRAGQKGTGKWSVIEAQQLGIPATAIEAAVAARVLSSLKDERHRRRKGLRQGRRRAVRRRQGRRSRRSRAGAVCRQDRRLRAGLRRDGGRVEGIRLEPADADHRQDLARRLHHPLAVPRHARQGLRAAAPVANLLMAPAFVEMMKEAHPALAPHRRPRRRSRPADAGAVIGARLFRQLPPRRAARRTSSRRNATSSARMASSASTSAGAHHGPWGSGAA